MSETYLIAINQRYLMAFLSAAANYVTKRDVCRDLINANQHYR